MSRFWRSEYERLIAEHHAAGHTMAGTEHRGRDGRPISGTGLLDPAHLDSAFWRTAERAAQEQREYGRDEFFAELHEAKAVHRVEQGKRYIAGVMRGVEHRRWLEVRRARIRLKLAMIERGIPALTEAERAAIRRVTA